MNFVGTIYHFFPGYLDHIVPLCSLLDIPVVVTEQTFAEQIKKYYKNVDVILHENYLTYCQFLVNNYKIIFSCQLLYSDLVSMALLKMNSNDFTIIWLPHGNSDKGHESEIFKPLEQEQVALVYGNKMLDAFKKQNVYNKIKNRIKIGNFRQHYYQSHKPFYDEIINREIKNKLAPNNKNILYAPTWEDYENNGSYNDAISTLLENLPDDFNLIVKPHHNTYLKFNANMIRLHGKYENHPNVLFIKDFPTIYPLLDFVDIYLGDMSSVGYDFLTFNKPMFFLNTNTRDSEKDPGLFLYRCGTEIKPSQYANIYNIIREKIKTDDTFTPIREEISKYTFGELPDFENLKKEIHNLIIK